MGTERPGHAVVGSPSVPAPRALCHQLRHGSSPLTSFSFSLLQTPKPPPGKEPPKAVSVFPLLLALSGLSPGACGRHFAVVQALGPEGLHDIVVGYLRIASPEACLWHTSWGSR